jgi:hypothetical protein
MAEPIQVTGNGSPGGRCRSRGQAGSATNTGISRSVASW